LFNVDVFNIYIKQKSAQQGMLFCSSGASGCILAGEDAAGGKKKKKSLNNFFIL
jgi:hypothetical protein